MSWPTTPASPAAAWRSGEAGSAFGETFERILESAIEGAEDLKAQMDAPEAAIDGTGWESDTVSSQLKVVANIMAAQKFTQSERDVFFVSYGGWDTHASIDGPSTASYPSRWSAVNNGLARFASELKAYHAEWVAGGKRGVWLSLPAACHAYVPVALASGFSYHPPTPDDVQRVRHGGVSTQRRPLAADGLGGRRRPPLVAGQPPTKSLFSAFGSTPATILPARTCVAVE